MKLLVKIFVVLVFFQACNYINSRQKPEEKEILARVFDKYLYKDDLKELSINSLSKEDSARITQEFIENWVKHQLMLEYAIRNLPSNKLNIEKQVQDYKNALIILTYEREIIEQKLDTIIHDHQLFEFYNSNIENFKLPANIYRLSMVKLLNDSPKLDSVKIWMKSNKDKDIESLQLYAHQYAVEFNFNDSIWFDERMINTIVPVRLTESLNFAQKQLFEVSDSNFVYFLRVNDFKIKESVAPLSYIKSDISKIILNKRKLDLVKDFSNRIYKDAAGKKTFEIYN